MIEERVIGPSVQQQAVMDHPLTAPALVDAGAGTGKTYTIVERVAQLDADKVNGCPASSILLLTFSKKAAAELRGRIIRRLGPGVEPPECATFHAFALSTLKEHAFDLALSPDATLVNEIDARVEFWKTFDDFMRGASGADAANFALRFGVIEDVCTSLFDVRQQLRDRGISIDDFRRRALAATDAFATTTYRTLVEVRKTGRKQVYQIAEEAFVGEVREERARIEAATALFRAFDDRLRARDALTFADLLDLAENAVRSHPDMASALRARFAHCIVDEYQDTDPRQLRLLRAIFGDACERVMVVGDPRQSIYGFRGVRPSNVADFGGLRGCAPYSLTENRRSRQEILDLAHAVIRPHFEDPEPLRATRGDAGAPVIHAASRWAPEGQPAPNAAVSREIEAAWVVANVVRLLQSGRRIDGGGASGASEALAPRHIAILSRRKTKLQPLIDALNTRNVPFRQYGGAGFYDAPEVLDALAWFRLVADPLDDNAVARVLASPGIGVSDATMVTLCRGMREDDEHLAVRALVADLPAGLDADGRERLDRFRRVVDALDEYAGAPLVIAWEATLDRAGLMLSADVRGGHRHDQAGANLEKLSAMVRGFSERNPGAKTPDFIRYVRELARAEADDQEADPPSADAVNVMTIHAAKGLEWPIVFVIDVWPDDPHIKPRVWIDPRSGALLVTEGSDGRKPFHSEMADRQDDGTGIVPSAKEGDVDREREERRLFYVGLTRARDELFVSGGRKHPSKKDPSGRPHPFLREAIEWVRHRGWATVEEPLSAPAVLPDAPTHAERGALPLGDFIREARARPVVAVPTLSFTSIAQYEQCPRSVTYGIAYHVPGLASREAHVSLEGRLLTAEAAERKGRPLLSLGVYGELVHRALELWGRSLDVAGSTCVADAIKDLGVKPSKAERERAAQTVDTVIAAFAGWKPLLVEAPFTLDVDGIAVSGYIDLVAADPTGRTHVIDYKTGVTGVEEYALQLALYREAAKEAYGIAVDDCTVARIDAQRCELQDAVLPDAAEIRRRVASVAAGIRSADLTPVAGPHCALCPYRAAPCTSYEQ